MSRQTGDVVTPHQSASADGIILEPNLDVDGLRTVVEQQAALLQQCMDQLAELRGQVLLLRHKLCCHNPLPMVSCSEISVC